IVADSRADDLCHEYLMPSRKFWNASPGKQAQHELGGLLGRQIAGIVTLHQFFVTRLGFSRVACATSAGEKISPLVVTIQREQGVIEIEQGKTRGVAHGIRFLYLCFIYG